MLFARRREPRLRCFPAFMFAYVGIVGKGTRRRTKAKASFSAAVEGHQQKTISEDNFQKTIRTFSKGSSRGTIRTGRPRPMDSQARGRQNGNGYISKKRYHSFDSRFWVHNLMDDADGFKSFSVGKKRAHMYIYIYTHIGIIYR